MDGTGADRGEISGGLDCAFLRRDQRPWELDRPMRDKLDIHDDSYAETQ